jgi:uncharacterized protein (DUF1684 family)
MTNRVAETLDLLDYRRRVGELYRTVRSSARGSETWQAWRDTRDELLATHPQSALDDDDSRRDEGLRYFEYDPGWRLVVEVEPVEPTDVAAGHSGPGVTPLIRFGQVTLPIGDEPTLSLFRFDQYADGIFVPFRDTTAGTSTYGGGRYLLDTPKGADLGSEGTRIVLDFNYAYHPSCVYSSRWTCPMPPRDNWLSVAVRAGERL